MTDLPHEDQAAVAVPMAADDHDKKDDNLKVMDNNGEDEVDVKVTEVLEDEDALKKPAAAHDDDFDLERFPVREVCFYLPYMSEPLQFNPVVSAIGVFALWGLSIWCMVDPDGSSSNLGDWRAEISRNFTWIFICTRGLFFFFLLFIVIRFGHIKLGKPDEPPEFTTGNYFMMIFAAGVAVGLFVYGVTEPMWHQNYHFYAREDYHTQDEVDMYAINLTVTNWGFTAWAPYLMVASAMALAGHRFGLPMTFRSCFYPILGEYTWGWIGDILDGVTIVTTVAGVCTSLGLGAIQIVAGFQFLGWVDDDISTDKLNNIQNLTIWAITAVATASVISGLHAGVQMLSQLAFGLGMLLLFMVLIMDSTKYCLNLIVQEIGYYFQWSIFELNLWTDTFAQLLPGEGRAIDGQAGSATWMNGWMIFYQAWWVSWAAFVGMFVARISRGRTLGELISYSLVAPAFYCILWFCTWGGVGLRQSRQALELEQLGELLYGDNTTYQAAGNPFCYDVPQENIVVGNETVFENHLPGVTPVCKFDESNSEIAAYNVLYSFSFPDDFDEGYGPFLTVLFIIGLAIYFATSSDSGSLIVDHLASNGRMHHHWLQRFFWAVTEGAVATALLSAGGSNALSAVQAASVIAGLPYVVMLFYLVEPIWSMCQQADASPTADYVFSNQSNFSMPVVGGVFNVFEYVLSGARVNPKRVEMGMDAPSMMQIILFFKSLFAPYISLCCFLETAYPRNRVMNYFTSFVYAICFFAWVVLFAWSGSKPGLKYFGWAAFFACGTLLASIRNGFRTRFNIRSNILGDFLASIFMWPQVISQMTLYCQENDIAGHDE